jgi:hypothetical protein
MDKKSTGIIVAIVLIAIFGYVYISLQRPSVAETKTADTTASSTWENAEALPSSDVIVTPKTTVTAKHAYINGVHTIAGELPLPTPCHILESHATASPDKKQILVTLTSSIKTDQMCAQVITPARFKVSAAGEKGATIIGLLNGQEVTMNLIEATQGENLDNFELYIKG